MGFKSDMLTYLKNTKERLEDDSNNYISIGKNPLDVLYDTSKMAGSMECLEEVIAGITELADNDSVCSVEIPVSLNKRLVEKVEERKAIMGESGDEDVIKRTSKINGHISVLDDMIAMAGYYTGMSARALFQSKSENQ